MNDQCTQVSHPQNAPVLKAGWPTVAAVGAERLAQAGGRS